MTYQVVVIPELPVVVLGDIRCNVSPIPFSPTAMDITQNRDVAKGGQGSQHVNVIDIRSVCISGTVVGVDDNHKA